MAHFSVQAPLSALRKIKWSSPHDSRGLRVPSRRHRGLSNQIKGAIGDFYGFPRERPRRQFLRHLGSMVLYLDSMATIPGCLLRGIAKLAPPWFYAHPAKLAG